MRVHYLQHVPFEGLGSIEASLLGTGHTITCTRLYSNDPLPSVDEFECLIVMGGPMGANDDARLSWLGPEKVLIRKAIDADKRVLGICLGAQLIAAVLGARVFPNTHREIGWFEIRRTAEAAQHSLGTALPDRVDVFHWHGDTFDLPTGAIRLAESRGCINQAFAVGTHVLALQFHLETTPRSTQALIDECHSDLAPGTFVQTPSEMLQSPEKFEQINQLMASVLKTFL
ncbi:MAG: glutamine amidotransferase class-I [Schlesneria sp.]|nr:glutamine amidotransferase class-I [Schlesneria sp.]